MLTLLLIDMLTLAFNIQQVRASPEVVTRLYVNPAVIINPALTPGNTFTVNVTVANVTNLWTFEFFIRWDPSMLNYTSITNIAYFLKYGNPEHPDQSAHITGVTKKNQTEGWIAFGYSLYGSIYINAWPVSGTGTLATITFLIEKTGSTVLDIYNDGLIRPGEGSPPPPVVIPHVTEDGFFMNTPPSLVVNATLDVHPHALNLWSRGRWITCYIALPEGYNITDIDVSTIKLNDTIPAEPKPTEIGDYDNDTIPDLMVKFNRAEVIQYINDAQNDKFRNITLTITGSLTDETPFEGTYTIKTISPDINNDGIIDVIDIVLVVHALGTAPASGGIPGQWHAWNPNADINQDQVVDAYDLATTTLYYGETA